MSLFSHGRFFYLLFIFFNIAFVYFKGEYGLAGIKIRVAGKISVTGNARKRSMIFKKGITSSNNIQTKVSYDFYLVRTKTGCLGVSIYLYYN
jgi:ribosomal protein S3